MSKSAMIPDDLWTLIDQAIDETASTEISKKLEAALLDNPELQQFYLNYCRLHTDIFIAEGLERAAAKTREKLTVAISQISKVDQEKISQDATFTNLGIFHRSLNQIGDFISKPASLSVAMAFVVMVSVLATLWLIYPGSRQGQDENVVQQLSADKDIGQINWRNHCVWDESNKALDLTSTVFSGEVLKLKQGSAEIVLKNGVCVILHGPATFSLNSLEHSHLLQGFVEVYVPKNASGYEVKTAAADVKDLGTRFIVGADELDTEVHVLKGLVEVQPNAASQKGNVQQLTENQSIRISSSGITPIFGKAKETAIEQKRFANGRIEIVNASFELPSLPFNKGGSPLGWAVISPKSNKNGCRRPDTDEFITPIPEGNQFGYVQQGRTVSQTLKHRLVENHEYKFSISIGKRKDGSAEKPVSWTFELLAGDQVLVADDGLQFSKIEPGIWKRLNFNFRTLPDSPGIGKQITIRFKSLDVNSQQAAFDDLVLYSEEIEPEEKD